MRNSRPPIRFAPVALVLVLCACGASPSRTSSPAVESSASFDLDGLHISVSQGPETRIDDTFPKRPALNYSGPAGCGPRAFEFNNNLDLFRYSSRDAYLVDGQDVFHFTTGPRRVGGQLVWDQRFGKQHFVARLDCPPPPPSGPLLPPRY